jgi:carboxyl-terminal processing protease
LRKGAKKPLEVTITRDLIEIKSVRFHAEGDVGYIRVTSFSEQTHPNLVAALESLQKEAKEMKGLVLDLRNNPGGLLEQAVLVADTFLDKGEIVSTRERDPEDTQRFSAKPGDLLEGLPIVVLINQGSASASEIVAGALKDQRRAVVMGTQSFGKGSVQTVIPLENHGAMRLTTSRYYTPAGTSIQAKGITPDIKVEPAKVEAIDTEGVRTEADLPGRLTNNQDNGDDLPSMSDTDKKDGKKGKKGKQSLRGVDSQKDYQLHRALDLIRGLYLYDKTVRGQSSGNAS